MLLSRRNLILTAGGAALMAALPARAGTQAVGGRAFGSTWRLVLPQETDPRPAALVVERVTERINATLSPWRTKSEITVFNGSPETGWQSCSEEMAAVADSALAIAQLSGGAFDPTVGPLVARFGFGPISGQAGLWQDIATAPGQLKKADPDLTLDFCGIAKGYALDIIAEELGSLGISSALIELGGEVRVIGVRPDGMPWRIGIERPGTAGSEMQRVVAPGVDLALATSGTSAQGFSAQGRSVAHLINPNTSRPIPGDAFSVSVLAKTGMRADALATALAVMGPDVGADWAQGLGVDAMFVSVRRGYVEEKMTGNFESRVIK